MVVFAVDVVRHRATERDKSCPGGSRQEPSMRDDHSKQVGEGKPGFGPQESRVGVERDNPVKARRIEERPGAVETRVAVGTTQTDRQFALPARFHNEARKLVAKTRSGHMLRLPNDSPPRKNISAFQKPVACLRWRMRDTVLRHAAAIMMTPIKANARRLFQ